MPDAPDAPDARHEPEGGQEVRPDDPLAAHAARALDACAEAFWRFQCREFPMEALLAGQAADDPVLFREAPDDFARRAEAARAQLAVLAEVPAGRLDLQRRASHRLLARELEDLVQVHATRSHLRPWLLPAGPEFRSIYLANLTHVGDRAAAEAWADRLATLAGHFDDVARCLREGRAQGLRFPRVVLQGALANLRDVLAVPAESSAWIEPFRRSPAAASAGVSAAAERASRTVAEATLPALRRLAACIADELLPVARASVGCRDDVQGGEAYAFWMGHFTTTPGLSAEAVHALGLSEVARIGEEMGACAAEAGHAGDLPGYRAFLAAGARFVAPSAEALRERAEIVCKRIDAALPGFFGRLPRVTYGVQTIPPGPSERMPPAYAQPGPADRTRAGTIWVSGLPAKVPTWMLPALVLHEGWPGHLMHIALMQENEALPAFRRANFTKYSACIEGWALYCEQLGGEMGTYTSPHERYGRLDMELWRACRLVVDTGLHAFDWTREQAVSYMAERLSLSRPTIEAEVDRYIAMPAQALGYQIGLLRFRDLRERAQRRLGERFDVRAFHDTLLAAGPVTLPILDEGVEDWLAAQASHDPPASQVA